MARKSANPNAIPKHVNYNNGVFCATMDLRAIILALGYETTTQLAKEINTKLQQQRIRSVNDKRKVNNKTSAMVNKQFRKHIAKSA